MKTVLLSALFTNASPAHSPSPKPRPPATVRNPQAGLHHPLAQRYPSNLDRGLVAMGEGVLLAPRQKNKLTRATTTGCGPCLGVAVTYRSDTTQTALLAHLQPEADKKELAKQVAAHMPDDFHADMEIHIATAFSTDASAAEEQKSAARETIAAISEQFDHIAFDEDNVHYHDKDSISVDALTLSISTDPVEAFFTHAELDDMRRRMQIDSSAVQYFL